MKQSESRGSILVVDDAADTREVIRRNLESKGYHVLTAKDVSAAITELQRSSFDLVITDMKMPGASGLDLVRHINENYSDTEVMMITGYPTIESAVEAVKTGAEEYLAKPFTDDELFSAIDKAFTKLNTRRMAQNKTESSTKTPPGLIGMSQAMQKVYDAIAKAATTKATVLITGESGTGKELVARAIHYMSDRASAPFVPVNCGAIPETLLESELFGYVKGAFTGAATTRAGFFQTAEGGTVFLDEISETHNTMQVKLLRVLQEREVCMVGSNRTVKIDVRILAATNKDLHKLVKQNHFREDLFYRLNVLSIEIPPLRHRDDDILVLTEHFSRQLSRERNTPPPRFSDDVLAILKNYHWPGNVRELENIIHRLIVMSDGEYIDVVDLPAFLRYTTRGGPDEIKTLAEMEAEYITSVLARVDGNKTQAAHLLGIDRKTLREKLKRFETDSE